MTIPFPPAAAAGGPNDGPLAHPAPERPRGLGRLIRRTARPAPRMEAGVRLYAIGDVHGRLDLFDVLLAQVRADDAARGPARTLVVQLGDLIDRGPDSAGVVRRAMAGLDWATLNVLGGNHEQAMLDALDGDRDMLRLWLDQGGDAALRSWGVDPILLVQATFEDLLAAAAVAVPAVEREWLAERPLGLTLGDYHFVHAGIRPGVPLAQQSRRDALWIRREFLGDERDHGVVVVHGHTVFPVVDVHFNRIGIDTGAYASGRLTALGLEGGERWTLSTA